MVAYTQFTVAELMEELSRYNPRARVIVRSPNNGYDTATHVGSVPLFRVSEMLRAEGYGEFERCKTWPADSDDEHEVEETAIIIEAS